MQPSKMSEQPIAQPQRVVGKKQPQPESKLTLHQYGNEQYTGQSQMENGL